MSRRLIAVIDCRNRHEDMPDQIDAYPETPEGRKQAEEHFLALVAEDVQERDGISASEAKVVAKQYLSSEPSIYEVGDGYICLMAGGIMVHE